MIRKCFRYAQDKLKDQFKEYLSTRKKDQSAKVNFKKRGDMEMIEEEGDQEMDSDEREFVENISWDTESDPADVEGDDELIKQHFQDKDHNQFSQDDINSDLEGAAKNQEDDQEMEFGEFFNYQLHAFKKKYRTLNSGYTQWKFKQQRQRQSESEPSLLSKDQILDEDSVGRDSYDYELYEEKLYSEHQSEVERNIRLKNEMEEIVAEKKSET